MLTEIVLGAASLCSATLGSTIYGFADAKGTPLPGREYIWPATLVSVGWVGSKIPLPDNGSERMFGGICAVGTTVVGAGCYGIGYLVGNLSN